MASDPSCSKCVQTIQWIFDIDDLPTRRMFKDNNRNILIRQHAVSVIAKLAKMYHPDAYIPYLAMNYFDRLLCDYDMMPAEGLTSAQKVRLIALSCFAVSCTVRRNSFLITEFLTALQGDNDLNWISHSAVTTMQQHIREKLKKKMQPVNAFWFLDHYYTHFKPLGLERRSINEIVVQAQGEHTFVDYMPTDIAFSACVAAATIALKELPEDINHMFSNNVISYRVKDVVKKMIELCHRMNILIDKSEVAAEEIEAEKQSLAKNKGKGKDEIKGPLPRPRMEHAITNVIPQKHLDFALKWATEVPPLENTNVPPPEEGIENAEPRESTAISLRIPGTGKNINVGCCTCNIS